MTSGRKGKREEEEQNNLQATFLAFSIARLSAEIPASIPALAAMGRKLWTKRARTLVLLHITVIYHLSFFFWSYSLLLLLVWVVMHYSIFPLLDCILPFHVNHYPVAETLNIIDKLTSKKPRKKKRKRVSTEWTAHLRPRNAFPTKKNIYYFK